MSRGRWLAFGVFVLATGVLLWTVSILPSTHHSASAFTPSFTVVPPAPEEMKPYTEAISGTDVKFDMVPVQGSSFIMGSPQSESKRSADEGPQHKVRLNSFWMEKFETRWDEYDAFAFSKDLMAERQKKVGLAAQSENEKAADAVTRPTPPYTDPTFGFGREGHPVINITHHAAMAPPRCLYDETGTRSNSPTEAAYASARRVGPDTPFFLG